MTGTKNAAAEMAIAPETENAGRPPAELASADVPSVSDDSGSEAPAAKPPGERFRGWYTNKQIGYRRMTDEIAKLIVVKFNEQPGKEVIARLKEAGFRY